MKKKILFLCPGNSCHSQMAEGLLRHFYGSEYEVFSAGVNPVEISKNAVEVMKEIGIDISKQASKHVNEFLNENFDIIITVCGSDNVVYPRFLAKAQSLYWDFFDPAEGIGAQKDLPQALRQLRDDIKAKIIEHFKPHL